MRRAKSTEGRDATSPAQATDRRAAAIAAMGYRLAAAGPRTRQRLMDREIAGPERPAEPAALAAGHEVEALPALSAWDDAAWERRISGEPEPALARLSLEARGFPVWRAAALLASAACGFSLVLWGQSLHFEQKLHRSAAGAAKPVLLAESPPDAPKPEAVATADAKPAPATPIAAPEEAAKPPEQMAAQPAAQPPVEPAAPARAAPVPPASPSIVPTPADQHPWITAGASPPAATSGGSQAPARQAPAAPPPPAPPATNLPSGPTAIAASTGSVTPHYEAEPRTEARQTAHRAPATGWASAAPPRPLPHHPAQQHQMLAMSARPADPWPADPRPAELKSRTPVRTGSVRHDLPRWLTENHPDHAPALIMSPPPHDLEPPRDADLAAKAAPASPPPVAMAQANLPPIPEPGRRPPMIYAQAQIPASRPPGALGSGWAPRPYYNASPYYGGYPQAYGGYAPMPPPTPYGEP